MKNTTSIIMSVISGVISVVAIIFGLSSFKKTKDASEILVNAKAINVPENIVKEAVNNVATKKVDVVWSEIKSDAKNELQRAAINAVNKEKEDLGLCVKNELMKRVNNTNIDSFKKELLEELKDAAMERLDDDIDDVVSTYKSHIKTAARVIDGSNDIRIRLF